MVRQDRLNLLDQFIFDLIHQVKDIFIMKIKGAAVDIRPLRQLPHRDVLCAFFHQQLHQRQTQLTFRFSHPTVRTGLFHIHIPLCWLFNDLSDLYSNIDAD